jgi:predicted LPLAT superfamily acyltransferase
MSMKALLLKALSRSSLALGSWVFRFIAWWIATGYFLFLSSRRNCSVELYRVLFPDRGHVYHLACAWRQFHSFAGTYADRIELYSNKSTIPSAEGGQKLVEQGEKGTGGIIVISHMGNYEIAARAFQELGLRLLIIMGEREAKQVAREQRETLMARGVRIHVAASQGASPLGGLEAIQFMREGGFVSIAGDLVWTDRRSLVPVRFFDRDVGLPAGPHLLALVSGAPLFTLFTLRVKRGRHQLLLSGPRHVAAASRSERNAAIQASAQEYAAGLEEMVRRHPFQWYVFEPFFPPLKERSTEEESGTGEKASPCTCAKL